MLACGCEPRCDSVSTRFSEFSDRTGETDKTHCKVVALRCGEVSKIVTGSENWQRFMRDSRRDRDIAVFDVLPDLVAVKAAGKVPACGGLCLAMRLAREGFQPKIFAAKPGSERRRAWI